MKIDMTDEQLETVINKAYNEGYKRGYQDGVKECMKVIKKMNEEFANDRSKKYSGIDTKSSQ